MMDEAERLVERSAAVVQDALRGIYAILVDELGCEPYVKTIYVGFSREQAMVAAAYPHSDCVELALALPEDDESPHLLDASHLTWPTLPVSLMVRGGDFGSEVTDLLRRAFSRVASGEHDVSRPPDFFISRSSDRRVKGQRRRR